MAMRIEKPAFPEECLVDNRVYTERRVFDLERERIFLKVWNFVCHESELPNAGDYLTTVVAGQPVLLCRDADGTVKAFFNTCRHRGAKVVREPGGNARSFTCLYHKWSYALDGQLIAVPEADSYKTRSSPAGLPMAEMGLVRIRAESMHRCVFVCFDADAPGLKEYLGEFAEALRYPLGSPEVCVAVVWQKTLKANWKMQPENSRDGYHATLLHKRLRGVSPPKPFKLFPGGHALQRLGLDYETGRKMKTLDGILASQPDLIDKFLAYPLPGLTREDPSQIATIFPDTLVASRFSALILERQIPIGPEETLFETRHAFLKSDSEEVLEIRRKHWMLYWGMESGNLPEDWEAWEAQQEGVRGLGARYSVIARGNAANEGLRGDDNRIRSFWAEWRQYMGVPTNGVPEAAHGAV
jgi:methanesulfonate monooxygenase subunit alpha